MKIDKTLVEKLGTLSRMELSSEEKTLYSKQLTDIVDFVEQLNEVDTEKLTRVRQISGLSNIMREDVVEGCDNVDELLEVFPERDDRELDVPSVL